MSMRKTVCFFAALTLAAGALAAADNDPFVGTWKLDAEKSTYSGVPKPKELTLTATDQGDSRLLTFNGTTADGSPIKMEVTEPIKGGPVKITGAPPNQSWDTATFMPISSATQDIAYSKDGKQVGVRHIRLARNHQTLTARFTGTDAQCKTITQNDVWQKQ
jgi:hypothetical protein